MKYKGQGGTAVMWGAGCILLAIGFVLFFVSIKDRAITSESLAFLEAFIAVILMVFGVVSFYLAHK
jgi:uncharacterized membrane protein